MLSDSPLRRLDLLLRAAGIPLDGLSRGKAVGPGGVHIDFLAEATAAQRQQARRLVENFDWSPRAQRDWQQQQAYERTIRLLNDVEGKDADLARLLRGLLLVVMEEINRPSSRRRTVPQLRAALAAMIRAGAAD